MSDAGARSALVVVAEETEPIVGEWLRRFAGPRLPIACHAAGVVLLVEAASGRWSQRAAFPFEGRE